MVDNKRELHMEGSGEFDSKENEEEGSQGGEGNSKCGKSGKDEDDEVEEFVNVASGCLSFPISCAPAIETLLSDEGGGSDHGICVANLPSEGLDEQIQLVLALLSAGVLVRL